MEDRVERLENLISLQDRTIEALNDTVYAQQKQIDDLRKLVERLAGKVKELDAGMEQGGPADLPPPHYGGV